MKDLTLFQKKMKEIEDLSMKEDNETALILLESLLSEYPLMPQILIKKAELIQLLPEESELGELSDAQKAVELAVEIDPKSVEAILELAHFHSAVLDQDKEAEKLFDRTIQICFEFSEDAYRGKIQSLIDRDRREEASQWIQAAQKLFPASVNMEQSDFDS